MINPSVMSSDRHDWNTPECVLERVRKMGPITLDPCTNGTSIVDAKVHWSGPPGVDGLIAPWPYQRAFVNPPYGVAIGSWIAKCELEHRTSGIEILALVPARTDAKWFRLAWHADALCFWYGRIKFLGASSSAPFPSVVLYFGKSVGSFVAHFASAGEIIIP